MISSGVKVYALSNNKTEDTEQPQTASAGNTAEEQGTAKDETVYVIAGADGAMQLSDGLKEFNEQGVQKLVDAVDGDLTGLTTRLRATIDMSESCRSFSGINDDMDGQVKFIYRTDAIES